MATPIGHAIAGYAIYGFNSAQRTKGNVGLLLLSAAMAMAPDLDVIPGILVGRPAQYHQGISHSLGIAVLVCATISALYALRGHRFFPVFLMTLLSYLSHLGIDMLNPDGRLPLGIPALWPFSGQYFISPFSLFLGVTHAATTATSTGDWIQSMFVWRNLGAIVVEIVLITPFVYLGRRFVRYPKTQRSTEL